MTDETKVLWCILAHEPCDVAKIAKASKLPREKVEAIVERLCDPARIYTYCGAVFRISDAGRKRLRPLLNRAFLALMGGE